MAASMKSYWNSRYLDGRIWGDNATPSAKMTIDWFRKNDIVIDAL